MKTKPKQMRKGRSNSTAARPAASTAGGHPSAQVIGGAHLGGIHGPGLTGTEPIQQGHAYPEIIREQQGVADKEITQQGDTAGAERRAPMAGVHQGPDRSETRQVIEETSIDMAASGACAREAEEPTTIDDRVKLLPIKWMRCYIRALFRVGGIATLARQTIRPEVGGVSMQSVHTAAAEWPEFAALIQEAQDEGHGMVDGAVYEEAVHGGEQPIYQQGQLVGNKRIRSPKHAELYYQRHGLMAAQQVQVTHAGTVTQVQQSAMADALATVASLLFGEPLKVVSDSDKKE